MPVRLQVALLLFPVTYVVAAGVAVAALLATGPAAADLAAGLLAVGGAGTAVGAAAAWAVAGRLVRRPVRPVLRVIAGGKSGIAGTQTPGTARVSTGSPDIHRRGRP